MMIMAMVKMIIMTTIKDVRNNEKTGCETLNAIKERTTTIPCT